MNLIIYAPFKGERVFWELAQPSVELVRSELRMNYADDLYDGIREFYCRSEDTYPIKSENGEGDTCDQCGREGTPDNPVFWSNDPYIEELRPGADNPVSLWCKECYHNACMEI